LARWGVTGEPGHQDGGDAADGSRLSRRRLLGTSAFAIGGGLLAGALTGAGRQDPARPRPGRPPARRLRVLSPAEAATAGAMADRVFPPDDDGPGATEVGVVAYLDEQLAGEWGAGARLYRHAPFHEAADSGHGYQLPLTPRALYKHVLPRIDAHVRARYASHALPELTADAQDAMLRELEAGSVDLALAQGPSGFTSADFFALFLANVKEGLFADPMYGGNRDVAGWRWIGYPGDPMAYGDSYFYFFSSWHTPYDVEPKGLEHGASQG
jgi:gluconate 2-dehydrogenase gamma chain